MPWKDIHLSNHIAHMWASGGTAHIDLLTSPVNLTGWGSEVTIAQVDNPNFYPAIVEKLLCWYERFVLSDRAQCVYKRQHQGWVCWKSHCIPHFHV